MIVIKNISSVVNYEQIKIENHFYELLTATVSHEMRTPLNAVITLLDNLDHFIINPKGLRLVQVIENSAKMLMYLVNDMLDIFQIKNGKFTKNELAVIIRDSLSQIENLFTIACEEKGISFRLNIHDNVPESLIFDDQRVKQVLLNLIQNAIKFTIKGGIVVDVEYIQERMELQMCVTDSGIGISEADQKKLFYLFGKLQSTQSMNTNGIGLGLNICKKIVESFGGVISVYSKLN